MTPTRLDLQSEALSLLVHQDNLVWTLQVSHADGYCYARGIVRVTCPPSKLRMNDFPAQTHTLCAAGEAVLFMLNKLKKGQKIE